MAQFPTLSAKAREALEIIVGSKAIDGSSLMKQMQVSRSDDVVTFIRELQKHDLIEVGGNVTPDGLPFAQFGVRPSEREYLHSLLKQTMA